MIREEQKNKIYLVFLLVLLFSSFLHKLPLLPDTSILELIKIRDFQV